MRPVSHLRGADPLRVMALLEPVVETLCASTVDLSRLTVVCDWIQYKASFRDVAELRPVLAARLPWPAENGSDEPREGRPPAARAAEVALELALDLRRCGDADLPAVIGSLLREHADPGFASRVALEPWGTLARSCIWRFNALYWQALSSWEEATGREYEQALPGGRSDARDIDAVRELILELFKVWDDLDARSALPAELYVVELGVGNGNQARAWLDEFRALSSVHSRDYYRRLQYLMGDYSPLVLGRALAAVAHHSEHVNALVVDATHPAVSLGFLRGKAFLVYVSNVYDNLPTDELARVGGRTYQVEARATVGAADARRIAQGVGASVPDLPGLVSKLLRLGPELLCEAMPQYFPGAQTAVGFWRDVWAALRLEERYSPLEALDEYQITPDMTGELLLPQLEAHGDIRVHVSNGALGSFADALPLLHPFGRLQCHDLFLTDVRQYRSGFFGPGKYDGTVVNWINGPLLHRLGSRAGFDVRIAPFAQRPASNVKTLTAQVRE
ncbi:MAG TPA: hypothetical protein VEL03_09400 [Streptosporangiaceae bacterium]|nr:hypothetical protein [Streptosporangiaceae bacterium]